jgi:hypothetical protein
MDHAVYRSVVGPYGASYPNFCTRRCVAGPLHLVPLADRGVHRRRSRAPNRSPWFDDTLGFGGKVDSELAPFSGSNNQPPGASTPRNLRLPMPEQPFDPLDLNEQL